MNHAQALIRRTDDAVLAAWAKGENPQLPEGTDTLTFFRGFAERQGMTRSWAVAESLLNVIENVYWRLNSWIIHNDTLFAYERAVQNLDTVFVMLGLRLDLRAYFEGRKKMQRSWDDGCNPDVIHVSHWDVWNVNEMNLALAKMLDLGETLIKNPPPTVEGIAVDIVGSVSESLPIIRNFQAFFPEFCAVLNQAGFLDLTEKSQGSCDPPTLEFQLPNVSGDMARTLTLPLAEILVPEPVHSAYAEGEQAMRRSAADFQGEFIGVVFEPGGPDDRDACDSYAVPVEIERACDRWALNGSKVGINHTDIPEKQGAEHPHFVLLRSWIQYGDYQIGNRLIKSGTWLQKYQAVSDWAKEMVRTYQFNSLSSGGSARYIED